MRNTEIANKIANKYKSNSLSTMLMVAIKNSQIHKMVILLSITLTFRWCDGGKYDSF